MVEETEKLEELISAILINCRGTNAKNHPMLPQDMEEQVIVKLYKDGHSMPMCRYLAGDNANYCSALQDENSCSLCLYRTFK